MSSRTLILSDLHMGRPKHAAISADALRPLWRDCDQLIVNGDVAEVHHPAYWGDAARQVVRLFDVCETDGVELTLLSGNHDPFITDLRHVNLANGLVFVTHGDVMHPAVAPWSPRAAQMRERHDQAMAALPVEDRNTLHARLTVSQHASQADFEHLHRRTRRSPIVSMMLRPWAVVQVLWYWRQFPKLAAKFMHDHAPLARFAVLGHTHRQGIWTIGGRTIINTGSYGFPGKPWGVMIEEDRAMSVRAIVDEGGAYAFEPKSVAEFDVFAGSDRAAEHTGSQS